MALKEGEQYLSISMWGGQVKTAVFKNKKKTENDPDYVGNGFAIWINKKKAEITSAEITSEDIKAEPVEVESI